MKALTEKELVLHLAGCNRKLTTQADGYTRASLEEALKDGKTICDLKWYARRLLDLLDDPQQKDKPGILDRLRELMFLGAVQDPQVLEKIREATAPPVSALKFSGGCEDPFSGKRKRKVG